VAPNIAQRLVQGNHNIEVSNPAATLYWIPPLIRTFAPVPSHYLYHDPVRASGFYARFFPNDNWEGPPVIERIDSILNSYFHVIPLSRPYSAVWSGWLEIQQTGTYIFGIEVISKANLYIDGNLVLETSKFYELESATIDLTTGNHRIEVYYQDLHDYSRLHLYWQPPHTQGYVPLPTSVVSPTSFASAEK
jgi:hypothetical protein